MKIDSNWYTETITVKHMYKQLEQNKNIHDNNETKYYFKCENNNNDNLYSLSKYKTNIKKENLPPWYCKVNIYGNNGWINLKNIVDIAIEKIGEYKHPIKDCILYISFNKNFNDAYIDDFLFSDYDIRLSGWDVINVFAALCSIDKLNDKVFEYYKYILSLIDNYEKQFDNIHLKRQCGKIFDDKLHEMYYKLKE